MPTTRYFVYKDLEKKAFDLDTTYTMAKVRSVLAADGWMTPTYRFIYYNPVEEDYNVLKAEKEATTHLSLVATTSELTLTNVNAPKPDLMGRITHWFTDRNMQAAVVFNQEEEAKKANAGKFEPYLLSNVVSTNPNLNVNFTNAVICEKGSVIAFNISSWGAAGYGFSIKSSKITFVNSLYVTNNGKYGTVVTSGVGRYQDASQMIQVDSNESLNIPGTDNVQYSEVRIRTWNVSSYKRGDTSYSSNLRPPQGREHESNSMNSAKSMNSMNLMSLANDSGDTGIVGFALDHNGALVPGDGIESGSPHAGSPSQHTFGSGICDVKEDNPQGAVPLGEIVIYFLVFKDHEAAQRTIQRLSNSNPY